jgi:hypothetical protein
MVSATLTECVVPPLVPVTAIVRVPVVARRLTVIVMVDDPAPVIEVGLKLIVTLLPCPEADSEMGELKPPLTAVVIVTCPDVLRLTVIDVGLALTEKPADVLVTVSDTVVVCTVLPAVPFTVMV